MSTLQYRKVTVDLKAARNAVNAGRASWRLYGPFLPSPAPKAPRVFGQGLGEKHPIYRAPVAISDMAWWDEECRKAEDRDLEQRAGEWEAANRLEAGGIL